MVDDTLPPIPVEDWNTYQSQLFSAQVQPQIASLSDPVAYGGSRPPEDRSLDLQPPPDVQPAPEVPSPPEVSESAPSAISDVPAPAPVQTTQGQDIRDQGGQPPMPAPSPSSSPGSGAGSGPASDPTQVVAALNAADAAGVDPEMFATVQQTAGKPMPNLFDAANELKQHLEDAGGNLVDGLTSFLGSPQTANKVLDRLAGIPEPSPQASTSAPGAVTPTTVGLSGGATDARLTPAAVQTLGLIGSTAQQYGLGADGAQAAQAVGLTEGALVKRDDNQDIGDHGHSFGPFQFYTGGQLADFAKYLGVDQATAGQVARDQPQTAIDWALRPGGYLGDAIRAGQAKGLTGADLATYAQQHGQVSVSPERAGQNYQTLFKTSATGSPDLVAPDRAQPRNQDLSQFGDPQLTTDEAYAACGPAAAVRFAEAFGRNPTLREATDLAKTVGWTSAQGMAGLDSEKALMDKMGVATKVVRGAAWSTFAQEAQTGNPVTISTQGHYFTADGFNPDTGAFHVGRSGLDLKGGSEWMTPAQMTNLMGGVQGGLLADNPTVPTPSTVADSGQQTTMGTMQPGDQGDSVQLYGGSRPPEDRMPEPAVAGPPASLPPVAYGGARPPEDRTPELPVAGPPAPLPAPPPMQTTSGQDIRGAGGQPAYLPSQTTQGQDIRDAGGQPPLAAPPAQPAQNPAQRFAQGIADNVTGLVQHLLGQQNPTGANPGALPSPADIGQTVSQAAQAGQQRAQDIQAGYPQPAVSDMMADPLSLREIGQSPPVQAAAGAASDVYGNPLRQAVLPNITEPNHPLNVLADLQDKYGAMAKLSDMTPEDRQRYSDAALMIGGVASPAELANTTLGPLVADARQAVSRFFHGTGGDFPRPEPGKFDPNGLFGPGYYLTDRPDVASSYGMNRASDVADDISAFSGGQAMARKVLTSAEQSGDPQRIAKAQAYVARTTADLEDAIQRAGPNAAGPNVRPVDVPQNLNLLNVEKPMPVEDAQQLIATVAHKFDQIGDGDVAGALQAYGAKGIQQDVRPFDNTVDTSQVIQRLYGTAQHLPGRPDMPQNAGIVAQGLADAGYDGIQYAGGRISPMTDASGNPIEHNALVVFPDSLDKLRNAVSGTQGGQALAPFASTLGGAAAGGVAGYQAEASTEPADMSPQNRLLARAGAAGAGALVGGALGYGAARLLTRTTGATGYNPVATASPELQKLGQMFEPAAQPGPASTLAQRAESVARFLTQKFTDRDEPLARVQQEYQKALGRPLNGDEMVYELKRLAPDPAAEIAVDEGLKPAVQSVGDDYRALRDYVTLRSNVQVADALGNDARLFSGGLTKADSQKAIQDLQAELGPKRFQKVQDAADQVSKFSGDLRDRLVDSGVLSRDQATQMETKYPDWVKTRILDYMKDPVAGQSAGSKIGLSSRDVHAYTQAGTVKAREDPIASMVAYAHQVERMAMKNESFNALRTIDQASPAPQLRQVAQDFSPTRSQVTVVGFENGQKIKYVTENRALGQAINGANVMAAPEWTTAWQQVFRSLATSRNPVFLAGNAALDIPTYVLRSTIRAGGPQHLPEVFSELAKGYVGAFQGLLQGEYRGATAQFLKQGGGQSGYFTGGEGQANQAVAALQRANVFQIQNAGDVGRLVKDLVTLKPVESLGERIELGPRVAAMRLAEKRGANTVQSTIEGRTVTVDFSQGGEVTKYLNQFIPFFNVGFQGPVQIARAFRDNPPAFLATTGSVIGIPAIAAEAWNRADPQRAQDYADVPQYVKDQGIVVMLPGQAAVDQEGNRKPLYAVLKLREWAPFAVLAREAAARVLGDSSRSWQQVLGSTAVGLSPNQATSVGQAGVEPISGIPILPAAAQLQFNKDFFRGRDIVTQRADQNASATAKAMAPVLQRVVEGLGLNAEIRPSAIDFVIRNQGAGVGGAVLGAGDIAAGSPRQDTSVTSLPVVGGLAGRFAGSQIGQGLQSERDVGLSPSSRQILRSNGVNTTPGPVGNSINGVQLRLGEETRYQNLANRYIEEAIRNASQTPVWAKLSQQGRQTLLNDMMATARERAGLEVLRAIPTDEKQRRLRTKSAAPAA